MHGDVSVVMYTCVYAEVDEVEDSRRGPGRASVLFISSYSVSALFLSFRNTRDGKGGY